MAEDSLLVVMPVYNDWAACKKVLPMLDAALAEAALRASVLLVDDGSSEPLDPELSDLDLAAVGRVDVLRLRRNLGHQRAISVALSYVDANRDCEAVVLMDCDGEDDPQYVPGLVERHRKEHGHKVVFAERTRRAEKATFKIFYGIYKLLYRLLTGQPVRVGNFSLIPRERLRSLVVVPELWNHYAAAVASSNQPYCSIPTKRAKRVDGKSHMNFTRLVIHGLSAMSVFSEVIGVRLMMVSSLWALLAGAGIAALVAVGLATGRVVPGWAAIGALILLVILLQALLFAVVFSFTILSGRKSATVLPARDYSIFIDRLQTVAGRRPA